GSSTSLTAVLDERQLGFIPAFRSIYAMLEAGPDLSRLEPKAVRNFLSILYFQIVNRGSTMTRAGRAMLTLVDVNPRRSGAHDVIVPALTIVGDRRLPVIDPIVRRAR